MEDKTAKKTIEKTIEKAREEPRREKGPRKGLVHIYTGDGKGKTTASVGLAVRAAGWGFNVLFVQFFKPESDPSGEKEIFRKNIRTIELVRGNVRHPCFTGPDTDAGAVKRSVRAMFEIVRARANEGFDLVILDEVIGAVNAGFVEIKEVLEFLDGRKESIEVALTGRDAPAELVRRSDYVTEMLNIKHPYDLGIMARAGIDF